MAVGLYLLNLADAGRNSATFAVHTEFVRPNGDGHEIRVPKLVNPERTKDAIYTFDKGVQMINNWRTFYAWLGRTGWAGFTPEAAAQLVPHWLAETIEYDCAKLASSSADARDVRFVESTIVNEFRNGGITFNLLGQAPDEGMSRFWYAHISDNLVASKRPIFS